MKFTYIIASIFFATVAVSANGMETTTTSTKDDTMKQECQGNERRCTDTSSDYCSNGKWVVAKCDKGTKCLGCGDWECVFEDQWQYFADQICPTYHEKPKMDDTCEFNQRRCTDKSTDFCDHGKWVASECPLGTRCLGCEDFECVHDFEFHDLAVKLCKINNSTTHKKDDKPWIDASSFSDATTNAHVTAAVVMLSAVGAVFHIFV